MIAVSLPITCARDLQHDLGDDRVDLAGHDRGALLELGQEQLADARRAGPEPISARSLAILVSETAITLSAPESSTSASRLPCASNGSSGGRIVQARLASRAARARARRTPGACSGPCRSRCRRAGSARPAAARCAPAARRAGPARRSRANSWPSVTGTASIRCVRPDLTMSLNSSALAAKRALEPLERGQQVVGGLVERGEVDGAGGRRRWTTAPCSRGRWGARRRRRASAMHLVGVHVRGGARAGLEDVDRELLVVLARGHLRRRRRRSARPASASSRPSSAFTRAAAPLMRPEPVDHRGRDALARDREVLDRLGGLAAPQLLLLSSRSCACHRDGSFDVVACADAIVASAAERHQLPRHPDRIVVGHQEAGARAARAAGRRGAGRAPPRRPASGCSGPRRPTAAAPGSRSARRRRAARAAAPRGQRRANARPRAREVAVAADVRERVADEVARGRVARARSARSPPSGRNATRAPCESARSRPGTAAARAARHARRQRRRRSARRCRRLGISTSRAGVEPPGDDARAAGARRPASWPPTSGARAQRPRAQKPAMHLGQPVRGCRGGAGGPRSRRAAGGRAARGGSGRRAARRPAPTRGARARRVQQRERRPGARLAVGDARAVGVVVEAQPHPAPRRRARPRGRRLRRAGGGPADAGRLLEAAHQLGLRPRPCRARPALDRPHQVAEAQRGRVGARQRRRPACPPTGVRASPTFCRSASRSRARRTSRAACRRPAHRPGRGAQRARHGRGRAARRPPAATRARSRNRRCQPPPAPRAGRGAGACAAS